MTEDEWLSAEEWAPLIDHLAGTISERKGTLYVCAGLRCIWDLLYDESSREMVEVAERAVDGNATEELVDEARHAAACPTSGIDFMPEHLREHLQANGSYSKETRTLLSMGVFTEEDIRGSKPLGSKPARDKLLDAASVAVSVIPTTGRDAALHGFLIREMSALEDWPGGWLVREIFGNPFRPVEVDPDWLTWNNDTVSIMARQLYDNQELDSLPILADALEEAGCEHADLLAHCRQEEKHFKGCWALDLLLGLE